MKPIAVFLSRLVLAAVAAASEPSDGVMPASVVPQGLSLSPATAKRVEALETSLRRTYAGRALLAETRGVERREIRAAGGAFRYLRQSPSLLAVDPSRLGSLGDRDAELVFVRELSHAAMGLSFDMPEAEIVAVRREMEFAVEKAGSDPDYDRWLKRLMSMMEARHESFQLLDPMKRPIHPAPRREEERLAYYLVLFARDPVECDWAIEWGLSLGPEAIRLWELEDFSERYASDLGFIPISRDLRYVRLKDRRYPAVLPRVAQSLVISGGVSRVRSALASLEEAPTRELREKVQRWQARPTAR